MSLKVGAGWKTASYETTSYLELDRRDNDFGMFFSAPVRVYSPENISSAKIVPRPKDMVAWLRDHPYLDPVNKPVDVDVGGVAGKQFDVEIPAIPENYPSDECGDSPCLPLFVDDPGGTVVAVFAAGYDYRIIVLNVEGQTVVIVIDFPDKRTLAKSEGILKTIEWKGVATSTSTAASVNFGGRSQERGPTEGPNAADLEAEAEVAARDYYRAAGSEDWAYTYEYLDSETQSMFTEKEWKNKNQWFADEGSVTYQVLSVDEKSDSRKPVTSVTLRLTYEDGSTAIRNTLFVLEDGVWKHRFTKEERNLFMPEASYEEFVAAKR